MPSFGRCKSGFAKTMGFLIFIFQSQVAFAGDFLKEVVPILTRTGCNQGPCHGSLNGKGGFKLSLRGENPQADFNSIVAFQGMRRVSFHSPETSLLLTKATALTPHEGGKRFANNSPEYKLIFDWIRDGSKPPTDWKTDLESIEIQPKLIVLDEKTTSHPISVKAYKNGKLFADLTQLASFDTSHTSIYCDSSAKLIINDFVEGSITARYLNLQSTAKIIRYSSKKESPISPIPPANFIDILISQKLEKIGLRQAEICSDSIFLRRIYLDLTGQLPSATEAGEFLNDSRKNKRELLAENLLKRPDFAEVWALKWSDLLRNEEKALDPKGVRLFHGWIKRSFLDEKPLDTFCREILLANGSTYSNPETNFYRALRTPDVRAEAVAQVFLGLRLQCAKCHNHPFDKWTQEDYHRFSAFFSRIQYQILENSKSDKLDKNEFVGEQIVWNARTGSISDPRTNNPLTPAFLTGNSITNSNENWIEQLAYWTTSKENPFFARAQANRIWYHLVGKGIVDPIDDFRESNLPIQEELLNALANYLKENNFSLKSLVKLIIQSNVYQARPKTNGDPDDLGNFAFGISRPLQAEELFDGISKVTGSSPRFSNYPEISRAHSIPGVGAKLESRSKNSDVSSIKFLFSFGKPVRSLTCECERLDDNTLGQAFHLISGDHMLSMITNPNNKISTIANDNASIKRNLDHLFLEALGRIPTKHEIEKALKILSHGKNEREAWEDIYWGILNSKEFLIRQ